MFAVLAATLDYSNYCSELSSQVVVPAAFCHILDLFQYGPPGESRATALKQANAGAKTHQTFAVTHHSDLWLQR